MVAVRAHARGTLDPAQRPSADRRHRAVASKDGGMSTAPPTACSPSAPAASSSAATTRRTSCPMANICRCGRCCPRSACRGSRPATSTSRRAPARGPSISPGWGKVGFQLCYEIIFSGQVVDRAAPARLHLQSVERRLVRPLGTAAASRPGAAARGRGRHSGPARSTPTGISAVIDARGEVVKSLPWRTGGRRSTPSSRPPRTRRRPSPASATSSRCARPSC